jgi:hypothetical protein
MRAFENTVITKEELLKELRWHKDQDNFAKGNYFIDGKGCAVGCSLESVARLKNIKLSYSNHKEYEKLFNIPEWLAFLEDRIFEGVSVERSKSWPIEFIDAINIGADLEKVKAPFLLYILEINLGRLQEEKFKQQREAFKQCIALWKREDIGSLDWESARSAVESIAESAVRSAARLAAESAEWSAAWSAVESAEAAALSAEAAALSAARSVVWSAVESAEAAARLAAEAAALSAEASARSAAEAAALSAEASARSVVWSAEFENFADKLLELIKEQSE